MSHNLHILEILKDGLRTITGSIIGRIMLFILPLFVGFILYQSLTIDLKNYVGDLISSISIFAGFLFTLMVYVSDKASNKKKELMETTSDDIQIFIERYLNFTSDLISQISYSIVFSIFLLIFLFISLIDFRNESLEKIIDLLVICGIVHFLIFILLIISNMYALFLQEINGKH